MSALRVPNGPSGESFGDLLTSLSVAYEEVRTARRALNGLAPSTELSAYLQSAEADLVRAMVVAEELNTAMQAGAVADRVISISQHRPSLSHPA